MTSIEVAVPDGVAAGDLLVAQIAVRNTDTVSAPVGWTRIRADTGWPSWSDDVTQHVFYRVADGTEAESYSWTFEDHRAAAIMAVFSGVDTAAPIMEHAGDNGWGGTIVAPSVRTTADDAYLVGLFASAYGNTHLQPQSMPLLARTLTEAGPNGVAIAMAGEVQAVPGDSGSRAATGNSTDHVGQLIALRAAGEPRTCDAYSNGLAGTYYDQNGQPRWYFTGSAVSRLDPTIDFSWGDGSPAIGIGRDDFSVRWTGQVEAPATGNYRFQTVSDDGVRLYVNGVLAVDNWTDHSAATDTSGQISLVAGQRYTIVMEYYERSGVATARLRWTRPGGVTEVIPASQLFACDPAATMPAAVADYRFDQTNWSGTAGEVLDSSANGRHGTAVGAATLDPGKICRAGQFDGVDDHVEVSGLSDLLRGTASLSFWIRTTQTGSDTTWTAPGVTGVERSGSVDDIFWGWLDASGRIGVSVGNDGNAKSTIAINNGAWRHIVLTRHATTGAYQIFIDGVRNTSGTGGTGIIGTAFSSIGRIEDTAGTPMYFNGDLDEVLIYDAVLTTSEVQSIYSNQSAGLNLDGSARVCPPTSCTLGGFAIAQDAYAIACPSTRAAVTIQALCVDGTVKTDYTGTVAMSSTPAGSFFDGASGGSAISSTTFTAGDSGSRTVYLYYNNEHPDVRVSADDNVAGVSSTATAGTDFRAFGFVAASSSSAAPSCGTASATLTAYGQVEGNPGCGTITGFSGSKNLKVWATYDDPASNPAGTPVQLTSPSSVSLPTAEPGTSNTSLNFANGVASFDYRYDDAGRVRLWFKHDAPPYSGTPNGPMLADLATVFYPGSFALSATHSGGTALTALSPTDGPTHVAGSDFNLRATAQCSDGTVTPNYRPTADTDRLFAYVKRTGPTGAAAEGALRISSNTLLGTLPADPAPGDYIDTQIPAASFSGGEYLFTSARYSEVGLIRLYLRDADYHGQTIGPNSLDIGRFIPARFELTANTPVLADRNTGGTTDFTYLGQNPIAWETEPVITVEPFNAENVVVRNYGGPYWRHSDVLDNRSYADQNVTTGAIQAGFSAIVATGPVTRAGDDFDATPATWIVDDDEFNYTRPANPENPFESDVTLTFAAADLTDADGVCYRQDITSGCLPLVISNIGGANLRYGQGFVQDSYGTLGRAGDQLPIALRAAYFDDGWKTNADDISTTLTGTIVDSDLPTELVPDPATVTLEQGVAEIGVRVTSGSGGYGRTRVDIPWPAHLGGSQTATSTFGIFRGDDRFLYWSTDVE